MNLCVCKCKTFRLKPACSIRSLTFPTPFARTLYDPFCAIVSSHFFSLFDIFSVRKSVVRPLFCICVLRWCGYLSDDFWNLLSGSDQIFSFFSRLRLFYPSSKISFPSFCTFYYFLKLFFKNLKFFWIIFHRTSSAKCVVTKCAEIEREKSVFHTYMSVYISKVLHFTTFYMYAVPTKYIHIYV